MLPKFKKEYTGLTSAQAAKNASVYGQNIDSKAEEEENHFRIRSVFFRTRFWLLLYLTLTCFVTAGVQGVLTDGTNKVINYAAAVCMALITAYDCWNTAYKSIRTEELAKRHKLSADVKFRAVRDSLLILLNKTEIVPDDIIMLEEGESVPADGRVLEVTDDLAIDESIFSGSEKPVRKQPEPKREAAHGGAASADEITTATQELSRNEAIRRAEKMRRAAANRKDFTMTIAGLEKKHTNTGLLEELTNYTATSGLAAVRGDVINKGERAPEKSALTGFRYIPKKHKNEGLLKDGTLLPHLVYKGTKIASGAVIVQVTAIGQDTLRSTAAKDYHSERRSAFESVIAEYTSKLASVALIAGVIVLVIGFLTFSSVVPPMPLEFIKLVFAPAATFALCVIPAEALLLTRRHYLRCIQKLSRAGVIAKDTTVIEKLNSITTLCVDKDGIITKSETELKANNAQDEDLLTNIAVLSCPKTASVSSIEKAIMMSATFRNLSVRELQDNILVREYPFGGNSTESRLGGNLWYLEVEGGKPQMLLCVKGSPEDVFSHCNITPSRLYSEQAKQKEYTAAGYQTVAVACAIIHKKSDISARTEAELAEPVEQSEIIAQSEIETENKYEYDEYEKDETEEDFRTEIDRIGENEKRPPSTIEELCELYEIPDSIIGVNLIPVGIMAFAQNIRENVPIAVKNCYKTGVTLRLMTGESREPAVLTARRAGLHQGGVITGDQLKQGVIQPHVWKETNVFARVSQAQKLKIVEDLQNLGEVVGVFGSNTRDNSWNAVLGKADLSVVMAGATGTQLESANLVMNGDNFGDLVNIITRCRRTHQNIKASLSLIMSAWGALVLYSLICLLVLHGNALVLPLIPAFLICVTVPVAAGFCMDSNIFEDESQTASAYITQGKINKGFIKRAVIQCAMLLAGTLSARLLFSEKIDTNAGNTVMTAYTGSMFAAFTAGVCTIAAVNLSRARNIVKTIKAVGKKAFVLLLPAAFAVAVSIVPFTGDVFGTRVSGTLGVVRLLLSAAIGILTQVWFDKVKKKF